MIKKDTIEYRLVSLIGLAGEIKTDELYKLAYGKEYIRKTISRLNSNGYIKVYKYCYEKYLRLTEDRFGEIIDSGHYIYQEGLGDVHEWI